MHISVSFPEVSRRGKKVPFSNPTFARKVHVAAVEHELEPREILKENLRERKILNRRELRISQEESPGGDDDQAPAKINWHLKRGYT